MMDGHKSVDEALAQLPGPNGEHSATVFEHGSTTLLIYAPTGETEESHPQDAMYFVLKGTGELTRPDQVAVAFSRGDVLLVPAGELHRFSNLADNFAAWLLLVAGQDGEPELSFEKDIRPLFRTKDVQAMKAFGNFDLSRYEDVREYSAEILERLEDGSMPCDGAWPEEQVERFRSWIEQGMKP